jgi:oligopeptide/dipeptide ABC transporter ATP-binding protein
MKNLLEIQNLVKFFPIRGGLFHTVVANVKAVDDVSLSIQPSKTLGLVGESGCGKSTLGRTILRLHEPTAGQVLFDGTDITKSSKKEMVTNRKKMQIIFQDPNASLNPRLTVREIVQEPLDVHNIGKKSDRGTMVDQLLKRVGILRSAKSRYPHEFSGGQRQRIGIARALALNPSFIVADEPVSALDVSVQSSVLNLISDLQKELGIAFLFISHDLSVIHHISHDVGVMYLGKIVEKASVEDLFESPKHPYTEALLASIPEVDLEKKREHIYLKGDVPSPVNPPSGCYFHPRCPKVMDICKSKIPSQTILKNGDREHRVRCHLYQQPENR